MNFVNDNAVILWCKDFVASGDPRSKNWIGVGSPWITFGTMALYLLLVIKILPWYMKDREPFKLRGLLIVYNFVLSIYSLITFLTLGFAGWFHKVNYQCYPNDLARTPENNLMLNVIWYFWISKFVELLDTIYFVLRKKDRQVTVLHVYHHCTMIFNVWITIKLSPVGHFTFIGFTNSFVHFPMYAYYGLAAIGPHMQKYLGWKKYITTIQLIQFVLNIFHGTQVLFNNCDVSLTIAYISVFQSFVFLILFLNFYHHTYVNIRKNARASNLKENMSINNSNGNLKSYCSWPTVNGYENVTLVNGNNSQSLHTKISSNGNSSNYMESSMEKLKKRPRKE